MRVAAGSQWLPMAAGARALHLRATFPSNLKIALASFESGLAVSICAAHLVTVFGEMVHLWPNGGQDRRVEGGGRGAPGSSSVVNGITTTRLHRRHFTSIPCSVIRASRLPHRQRASEPLGARS
jgi:hypothetical protein